MKRLLLNPLFNFTTISSVVKVFYLITLLTLTTHVNALYVGNPSAPCYLQDGILIEKKPGFSIRTGYLTEYVYQASFVDEFETTQTSRTNASLSTISGMAVLNVLDRWDIYMLVGTTKLKMEQMIEANRNFSWAIGTTATMYRGENFSLGADLKYFETDQKPNFFLVNGLVRPLEGPFRLELQEIQAAIAGSYDIGYFVPYIGLTYLFSKISPVPTLGLISIPERDLILEFEANPSINHKKIGLVLGTSLVSNETMNLNVETRMIDQNALNISGQLRF